MFICNIIVLIYVYKLNRENNTETDLIIEGINYKTYKKVTFTINN